MRRRPCSRPTALAVVVVVSLSAGTTGALAQSDAGGGKIFRLGVLVPTAASAELTRSLTLPELAKLGFVESRNLVLDLRVGSAETMPELARELVAAHPDVINAVGPAALRAARAASGTVPIVMFGPDPVAAGWANSLAHPGGNVTGIAILGAELDAKRLHLLHEAVPQARRVAALLLPSSPSRHAMRAVAASAGLEFLAVEASGPKDYPGAFAAMHAAGAQALVIMAISQFYADAAVLAALALKAGLPTVCEWAEMAQSGCLLGYGPSHPQTRRRLADYIARIFHGTPPGELPIEEPAAFAFAVNLTTARVLGLSLPPSILARADEVIE